MNTDLSRKTPVRPANRTIKGKTSQSQPALKSAIDPKNSGRWSSGMEIAPGC